jgi:hypothetical protein
LTHRRTIWAVAAATGAFLLAASGEAVPSPDVPAKKVPDATQQLRIRHALGDDAALGKFNLGVRVCDGVVTLHGPVPSHHIGGQAVALVKKLPGVSEVRNELYTPAADDALARVLPPPVTSARLPVPAERESTPASQSSPVAAQPVSLSLFEQIDRLRQRDRRFADIRIEVREGRVFLRGYVPRARDAWDFADQVGRLPGVIGVVQNVTTR